MLYAAKEIQSNPVNMDTGGRGSVLIMGVGDVIKVKNTSFIWKKTEEIKEDISIVKLNISNLHKAVITLTHMMPE